MKAIRPIPIGKREDAPQAVIDFLKAILPDDPEFHVTVLNEALEELVTWRDPLPKDAESLADIHNDTTTRVTGLSPLTNIRVGDVVVFIGHSSNGTNEHPAIVTRVNGFGSYPSVNLKVLPDCGEPFDATSVTHWRDAHFPPSWCYRER